MLPSEDQSWPDDAFVVLGIMKWNHREDPLTLVHAFKQLHQMVPVPGWYS